MKSTPVAEVDVRARTLARAFTGTIPLIPIRTENSPPSNSLPFAYHLQGSRQKGAERITIFLDRDTGRVVEAFLPMQVGPEGYQGDRVMDPTLLESRALSLFADARPFPQGEIAASYFFIDPPVAYGNFDDTFMNPPTKGLAARLYSPEQNAAYRDLYRRQVSIPIYRLKIQADQPSVMYQVFLDGRNGNLIFAEHAEGFGGADPQPIPPFPDRVGIGKAQGRLAKLEATSDAPSGQSVAVSDANRVLAGVFDAKTGTLWLRRTESEPYRAFRPDAKLRKALAAQVKRNEATGKRG